MEDVLSRPVQGGDERGGLICGTTEEVRGAKRALRGGVEAWECMHNTLLMSHLGRCYALPGLSPSAAFAATTSSTTLSATLPPCPTPVVCNYEMQIQWKESERLQLGAVELRRGVLGIR